MPDASVSAILLSRNSEGYVGEALQGALHQDCDPMEIVVSDDASEDGTFRRLERGISGYRGPHRVRLRRRESCSGSKSAHLNDVFPRTSGEILVSFDDDDVSEPSRVRRITREFRRDPRLQAVYSGYCVIDASGRRLGPGDVPHPPSPVNTRAWFARVDAYAAGTTLAVRRAVVDRFGALDPEIHEDIVLPFRASLLGEVGFIDEPLVRARRHGASLTANLDRFDSIQNYRARMLQGIERARRHLESRRADLRRAQQLIPERARELESLQEIAERSLSAAETTAGLVSPELPARLRTLVALFRSGAYRDELAQDAFLALLPSAYLRYKRHALAAARRRTHAGE